MQLSHTTWQDRPSLAAFTHHLAGSSLAALAERILLRDVVPAGAESAEVVPAPDATEESFVLLDDALLFVYVDGRVVDVGRAAQLRAQGAGVPEGSLCVYLQEMAGLTDQVC